MKNIITITAVANVCYAFPSAFINNHDTSSPTTATFKHYSTNYLTCHHDKYLKRNRMELHLSTDTLNEKERQEQDVLRGQIILNGIKNAIPESKSWEQDFDLSDEHGAAYYALFSAIRSSSSSLLGLKGKPFYLKSDDILDAMSDLYSGNDVDEKLVHPFSDFFTMQDLAKALEDDFLDANRGSTDNRKGWRVASVSTPRGSSFEDARMTLDEVNTALEKGTVIFNTAGSHIPKLASITLACTDAASLPNAVNMDITASGKRTSAPPHTDRQDVIVIQSQGKKHWRVYSPPDTMNKPNADIFARGKGDDSLPLYSLEDDSVGCRKLLDVTLNKGDVLFIPAGFPHTTDTTLNDGDNDETSIHLTFNFDTHVWDLDYVSIRRLALRRAGVVDTALGQEKENDNCYVGNVNLLPREIRDALFDNLPLGFLDEDKNHLVDDVTTQLETVSKALDVKTYSAVPPSIWKETVEEVRKVGIQLFDIHRDMYLAAIEEGRLRKNEAEMISHLTGEALARAKMMTPEKMKRLSLFRVKTYFEQINDSKKSISDWSFAGIATQNIIDESSSSLPHNWEFTHPLKVGDKVEADLGGAFFPATVSKIIGSKYDVKFFDGDMMDGLDRSMIKLLTPPSPDQGGSGNGIDDTLSGLTKKELKKLMKKNEKKSKSKNGFS